MKRLHVLPLLLLVACAAEDAQPDQPTAWNLSGPLVETVGEDCAWSGGDAIDLDLAGLDGVDPPCPPCPGDDCPPCQVGAYSPDDDRIACSSAFDSTGDGSAWIIECSIAQDPETCETAEHPEGCGRGFIEAQISKENGAGSLVWGWNLCTFRFDVVATDI